MVWYFLVVILLTDVILGVVSDSDCATASDAAATMASRIRQERLRRSFATARTSDGICFLVPKSAAILPPLRFIVNGRQFAVVMHFVASLPNLHEPRTGAGCVEKGHFVMRLRG